MLEGLMQNDYQLTLKHVLDRMRGPCAGGEVVTLTDDGTTRASYGEVARARGPLARGARDARRAAGRPRRDVHVELAAAPRAVHGRAVHGRRAAHAQHPAVPGAADLHRQPRAGQGRSFVDDSLVPLLAKVAPTFETVEHYVVVGDGDAGLAAERAPLRGPARPSTPALRLPRAGRAHGRGPLLHERHDRQPEGRPVLAPLERAPLPRAPGWPTRSASRRPTACCPSSRCST